MAVGNGTYKAVCLDGSVAVKDSVISYAGGPVYECAGRYKYYESGNGGKYLSINIPLQIFKTQFQMTVEDLEAADEWKLTMDESDQDYGIVKGIKSIKIGKNGVVAEYSDTALCVSNPDGIAFFPIIDTTKADDAVYTFDLENKNGKVYFRTFDRSAQGKTIAPKSAIIVSGNLVDDWKSKAPNYFCFTAEEDGTTISVAFANMDGKELPNTFDFKLRASKDGINWDDFNKSNSVSLDAGEKVFVMSAQTYLSTANTETGDVRFFQANKPVSVSGNIMSLLDGDNIAVELGKDNMGAFAFLFANMSTLTDASGLILPSSTSDYCYQWMFYGCSALVNAPVLPAMDLSESCYSGMFEGCSLLKNAPALPAMKLAYMCYDGMFTNCTALTNGPTLNATSLAELCYHNMFKGCTSLIEIPDLPATKLEVECYGGMFEECSKLKKAPAIKATDMKMYSCCFMFKDCSKLSSVTMLATNIAADSCLQGWLKNAGTDPTVTSRTVYVAPGMKTAVQAKLPDGTYAWTAVEVE